MKKALDQTVRELKREVNKKVLKVPSFEQKVCSIATTTAPNSESAPSSLHSYLSVAANSSQGGGSRRQTEKSKPLDETICYMMSQRPWTTRLQNSIRNLVPNFDNVLVLAVLRRSGSEGHPDRAIRFFRWVEKTGFRHDSDTCREVISILSSASMLNHARCILLDEMPKRSIQPDEPMIVSLLQAYGRARIPQEVVKLFHRMPELGVSRSSASYDTFFMAILRCGRIAMAKRVFNAMLRDGVPPTLSTYNTLIWGFCVSAKMDTANRFFSDMKERGISPDVITYNTLLNGWVKAKKLDEAQRVFAEITGAGFSPNCVSYNILIKGYVSEGKIDDGLRLYADMGEKGILPSPRTYTSLLLGLCDVKEKAGDACKLLNEMADRKITPKDQSFLSRLISCLCEAGDMDGALDVHRTMDRFSIVLDPSHYGVLMQSLCKVGKQMAAVELMDELIKNRTLLHPKSLAMDAAAYQPIIEYLCGHDQTQKAETFFRQLLKKGVDDKVAFNHLIRGHAKEGKPESAFELLGIMKRRRIETESEAYALLVESYLKKGEPADARTVLDCMIEQGHLPSASLFRSVMLALFNDGRVQTASRVMKTMIEKGLKENMDTAHKILEALFMRGHVEEALGRINLMLMNECCPQVDRILVHLCENGDPVAVHKLADFGVDRDCDISFETYDKVLQTLDTAGKTLSAYSILCKIKEKGQVVNKKGCEVLIKRLNAEGNTKQADILSRLLSGQHSLGSKKGKRASMEAF